MRQYKAKLRGFSHYSQSRQFLNEGELEKRPDESHDAYDRRTWRAKMHVTDDGYVEIPAMAIKQAIDAASKDEGEKIKGRGNKTWGSLFAGGVMVTADVKTNVPAAAVTCKSFWCDTMGNKGDRSAKRVLRTFPMIPPGWEAEVVISITNDNIFGEKVEEYLSKAGLQVGIGRFRPSKGGNNGMFTLESFEEI